MSNHTQNNTKFLYPKIQAQTQALGFEVTNLEYCTHQADHRYLCPGKNYDFVGHGELFLAIYNP